MYEHIAVKIEMTVYITLDKSKSKEQVSKIINQNIPHRDIMSSEGFHMITGKKAKVISIRKRKTKYFG